MCICLYFSVYFMLTLCLYNHSTDAWMLIICVAYFCLITYKVVPIFCIVVELLFAYCCLITCLCLHMCCILLPDCIHSDAYISHSVWAVVCLLLHMFCIHYLLLCWGIPDLLSFIIIAWTILLKAFIYNK